MTLLNGFNGGGCVAKEIVIEPLTKEAFTPFGDVLDIVDSRPLMINRGTRARYSDLARLKLDADGRLGRTVPDLVTTYCLNFSVPKPHKSIIRYSYGGLIGGLYQLYIN